MTPAEQKFKEAVYQLIDDLRYPGPVPILKIIGRSTARHSLNGRECRWRDQVLTGLGWKYIGYPNRRTWEPPDGERYL